jgi:hypothetical protein
MEYYESEWSTQMVETGDSEPVQLELPFVDPESESEKDEEDEPLEVEETDDTLDEVEWPDDKDEEDSSD